MRSRTSTMKASVILDGTTELGEATVARFIDSNPLSTFMHACGVESDIEESFNMTSEDGSLTCFIAAQNIIAAHDYLSRFTDQELMACNDEHGIEHCREMVSDLASVFKAAGDSAAIKINFAISN